MTAKRATCLFFVFISASLLSAEPAYKVIMQDLGPIPKGLQPQVKPGVHKTADDFLMLLLQLGYNNFSLPDDPTFECWEPIDEYFTGRNAYFGGVVANYDEVRRNVFVRWEIIGPKKITFQVRKNFQPLRVTAIWLIRTLANEVGTYQITVKLGRPTPGIRPPGRIIDQMYTRFIINQVF